MRKILFVSIFFGILMFSCHLDKLTDSANNCLNPPAASFSIEGGGVDCQAPCTVKFINSSTNAISYKLKFGDGDSTTFTSGEIFHTYDSVGVFSASLIAFGNTDCPSNSTTQNITVTSIACPNPPMASFSIQGGGSDCKVPCTVTFINTSSNATSYTLKFGDSNSDSTFTSGNVTHTYTVAGTYTATLSAFGGVNCPTHITTKEIIVLPAEDPPVADFSIDLSDNNGFAPCQVKFTNASINGTSYEWDFGDGSPIDTTNINPNHIYGVEGSHLVKLTVKNSVNTSTITKSLNINAIKFNKTIGPINSFGEHVIALNDGGYLAVGHINDGTFNDPNDLYAIKTDSRGTQIWERTFGAAENLYLTDVIEKNGINLLGYYFSDNGNETDIYLELASSSGMYQIHNTLGSEDFDEADSFIITEDDNFMIAGRKKVLGDDSYDINLKVVKFGNVVSEISFDANITFQQVTIIKTRDNNYVIASTKKTASNYDIYLIKVDANGNAIWNYTYGSALYETASEIIETSDGSLVVVGTTWQGNGEGDIYCLKTNEFGILQWQTPIGTATQEEGHSVAEGLDGNIIIASSQVRPTGGTQTLLTKINKNNQNIIWEKVFGISYPVSVPSKIQRCADGGFILTGTNLGGINQGQLYLLKTDKDGNAN